MSLSKFSHEAWLTKALSNLSSAKKLSQDDDETLETALYHTQQCAEKSLKAYLCFQNQDTTQKHDLGKLLESCCLHDASFKILLPDVVDLLPYATYSRYPDDRPYISREAVITAIKKATTIFTFVKKKTEPQPFQFANKSS